MADSATKDQADGLRPGAAPDAEEWSDIAMAGFVGNIEGLTQGEGVVTLDGSRHTITAGDAVCRPGSLARGRRR